MRVIVAAFVALLTVGFGSLSKGEVVFSDHFSASTLAPAWSIAFTKSTGWTYTVPSASGTHLVVSDILGVPLVNDSGTVDDWGRIALSREFQSVGDFHLRFDISWDSEGRLDPMQKVFLTLRDVNHQYVANAGYDDSWVGYSGSRSTGIRDVGFINSDKGSMPLSGTASIEFQRSGSTLSINWNGQQIISGTNSTPIAEVQLTFEFFNYNGSAGRSTFANESVDSIILSSSEITAAVPEPFSLSLWFVSAISMALSQRWKPKRRVNSHRNRHSVME